MDGHGASLSCKGIVKSDMATFLPNLSETNRFSALTTCFPVTLGNLSNFCLHPRRSNFGLDGDLKHHDLIGMGEIKTEHLWVSWDALA